MFGDSIDFDTSLSLRIFERLTAESLPRRRATLLWICVKGIRRTLTDLAKCIPCIPRSRTWSRAFWIIQGVSMPGNFVGVLVPPTSLQIGPKMVRRPKNDPAVLIWGGGAGEKGLRPCHRDQADATGRLSLVLGPVAGEAEGSPRRRWPRWRAPLRRGTEQRSAARACGRSLRAAPTSLLGTPAWLVNRTLESEGLGKKAAEGPKLGPRGEGAADGGDCAKRLLVTVAGRGQAERRPTRSSSRGGCFPATAQDALVLAAAGEGDRVLVLEGLDTAASREPEGICPMRRRMFLSELADGVAAQQLAHRGDFKLALNGAVGDEPVVDGDRVGTDDLPSYRQSTLIPCRDRSTAGPGGLTGLCEQWGAGVDQQGTGRERSCLQ